jgi:hypothetical protein
MNPISEKIRKEYKKLNEEFVRENSYEFSESDWEFISQKIKLSELFLEEYKEYLDWKKVFQYQYFSVEFITKKKYKGRINWKLIFKNKNLEESLIEKYWKLENKFPSIGDDVYYYRKFSIDFLNKYCSSTDILYHTTTQKLTEAYIVGNYWLIISWFNKESTSYGSKATNEDWVNFRTKQKHLPDSFFAQFKFHNKKEAYSNISVEDIEKVGEEKIDWYSVLDYCKNKKLLQKFNIQLDPIIQIRKLSDNQHKKWSIERDARNQIRFKCIKPEIDLALQKFEAIAFSDIKHKMSRNDGLNILFIDYNFGADDSWNGVNTEPSFEIPGFSLQINYTSRTVSASHFHTYHPMAARSNPPILANIYSFDFPFVKFENKEQISLVINSYVDSAIYYINCFDAIINKHSIQGIIQLLFRLNKRLTAPQVYAMAMLFGLEKEAEKGIKIIEQYLQNEMTVFGEVSKVEKGNFDFLTKQLMDKTPNDFLKFAKNKINENHLDKSFSKYEKNFNPNIEQKTNNPSGNIKELTKPHCLVEIPIFEEELKIYLSNHSSCWESA